MSVVVSVHQEDDYSLVTVHGDFDLSSASHVKERLSQLIEDGVDSIGLNLAGVNHVDSTGLGCLVWLVNSQDKKRNVCLYSCNMQLERILNLTGLSGLFLFADSEEEAIKHLTKGPSAS